MSQWPESTRDLHTQSRLQSLGQFCCKPRTNSGKSRTIIDIVSSFPWLYGFGWLCVSPNPESSWSSFLPFKLHVWGYFWGYTPTWIIIFPIFPMIFPIEIPESPTCMGHRFPEKICPRSSTSRTWQTPGAAAQNEVERSTPNGTATGEAQWDFTYPLVNVYIAMERSTMLLMGTSTISMAIFNCYVSSPEGNMIIIYYNYMEKSIMLCSWENCWENSRKKIDWAMFNSFVYRFTRG